MRLIIKKYIQKGLSQLLIRLYPKLLLLDELTSSHDDTYAYTNKNYKVNKPYHISDSEIGNYTYIAINSSISKTTIGKFCSIGPNFFCGWGIHPIDGISTSPMFYSVYKQNGYSLTPENRIQERKRIFIGNDVFIGANVTVLDGVTIGDGAVIGAGAVVSKNIPPYAVAVGCPIQILKYRMTEEEIVSMLKIKWWEFPDDKLKDVEKYFFDIEGFIEKHCGVI